MAKTDKQKISEIREKYAKEFSGKIREKDDDIRRLRQQIEAMQKEIDNIRAANSALRDETDNLSALNAELQKTAGLSESDIEDLKANIRRQKEGGDAIERLSALVGAMGQITRKSIF